MAWSSSGKESIALRQHATLGGRITDTSTQERQQQKSCVDQYQHHRSRKMISTRALSPRSLRKQYPMLIATVMDMMLNCS
ncbi:uncharacterized protein [Cicer arietinum]|uniref:uncharacterized protein isoform X4 n=1 Tax=Cicer arietinum TaxID=3827 RepID=UPI003CC5FD33